MEFFGSAGDDGPAGHSRPCPPDLGGAVGQPGGPLALVCESGTAGTFTGAFPHHV